MRRFIRRKFGRFTSLGLNPANWLFDLVSVYISRQSANKELEALVLAQQDVASFTLPGNADQVQIETALDQFGVCVLENFINPGVAIEAGLEVESYFDDHIRQHKDLTSDSTYIEDDDALWQSDYAWSANYLQLAKHVKPVVNIRSHQEGVDDSGMVDIFGVDRLARSANLNRLSAILKTASDSVASKAIKQVIGYPQQQANLYINRSVVQTRGPHIDNNNSPHKLFVYLSDVTSQDNGPYCYLPGSHKRRRWMSFERLKNAVNGYPSTEVSSVDRASLCKLLGAAGTAVITCQSGIHCGWPQQDSGRRLALVVNFY